MLIAESGSLVKEQLAAQLKDAIMRGRLAPGERVVESLWAREFSVAQASVREAINLLIAEGFLVKSSGRSARVTRYTADDIARIYQVRGALEGLAAQLAAESGAGLSGMEDALTRMENAAHGNRVNELVEADLAFHLALAEASGNPVLIEMIGRLLHPLFSFVLLRMMETHEEAARWNPDLPRHRQMIYLIRDSNPAVARQFVEHCVGVFVASAHRVWWPDEKAVRRRKRT
jgi:DNA-binding GntR family transcriptional regulator